MARFRYLTMDEALRLPRHELLRRIEAQQRFYAGKRRKSAADESAMVALGPILHRCLSLHAVFGAVSDALDGVPNGFWDSRPIDDPPGNDDTPERTRP